MQVPHPNSFQLKKHVPYIWGNMDSTEMTGIPQGLTSQSPDHLILMLGKIASLLSGALPV